MKKILFCLMLAMSLTILSLGISAEEAVELDLGELYSDEAELAGTYGDLTYIISNGEITITDCGESATSVVIPDTIDGCPVTSIGDYAFMNCKSLTNIDIPDSVTSIAYGAFCGCKGLESVNIPDGVTAISGYAFQGCASLTSIKIPDSVTQICNWAFEYCYSLTSITIPDSCTTIDESAFSSCVRLASITLGDNTTSIGEYAFANCRSLTNIEIPDNVNSIGTSAFNGCTSLEKAVILNKGMTFGSKTFSNCSNLTLYGYAGSTTEIYATENSIPFVALEEDPESKASVATNLEEYFDTMLQLDSLVSYIHRSLFILFSRKC